MDLVFNENLAISMCENYCATKNLNRVAVILLEKADWTLKEGKSSHVHKARVIHLSAGVQGFDQG